MERSQIKQALYEIVGSMVILGWYALGVWGLVILVRRGLVYKYRITFVLIISLEVITFLVARNIEPAEFMVHEKYKNRGKKKSPYCA